MSRALISSLCKSSKKQEHKHIAIGLPTFSISLPFQCSNWIDITTDRLTDLARKETDSDNLYNVYLIWVFRVIFLFCRLSCTGFKTFLSVKLLQSQSKSSNTNLVSRPRIPVSQELLCELIHGVYFIM